MRQYKIRIAYTETVEAEERQFVHEMLVDARDEREAILAAEDHFTRLGRESWVGWVRVIDRIEVVGWVADAQRDSQETTPKQNRSRYRAT